MALADPLSVTIGSAISLPRVTTEPMSATYWSADGAVSLTVSHQIRNGKRQTLVRLLKKKITTDPLNDVKSEIPMIVNISVNRPNVGFTEAELIELVTGAFTFLTAGTNANLKKVLGLES